jgi:hypothetical protein
VFGDWKAQTGFLEYFDDAICCSEPVRTATSEGDRVNGLDEVLGVECVGFTSARASATNVDTGSCPAWCGHHRRAGLPAAPDPLMMPDADTGHVDD